MQHEEPSRNKSKELPNKPNDSIPNPDSPQTTLIPSSPYSTDENNAIDQLFAIASGIESSTSTKKMRTTSPLAQGKKLVAKGQLSTIGYYSTFVRIGHIELITFIQEELSSKNSSSYSEKTVEIHNDHHTLQYYVKPFPNPVHDREWHVSVITKMVDEKTVVMVSVPCFLKEKARNVRPDRVRAEAQNLYKLTKISDSETRVDFYAEIELGGHIPRWIINRELPKFMCKPTRWQEHFQHQQKLNQLTEEDGKNMGIMLMIKKKGESVEKRLEAFLSKNEALQQLRATTIPQLDVMMLALLKNKLFHKKAKQQHKRGGGNRVAVSERSDNILNDLTEAEAKMIGRSFALLLLTTTEPAAAIDAWRLDNKVLVPLFAEHAWFESMINAIAKQLLKRSNLGLKWRVGLGAFLSIG